MNSGAIRIIPYTDKSFVVIGDTKPHKESIKNLGGKWNSSLTNKETGEKFMGWIFFLNRGKKNEVQNWIDMGCQPVEGKEDEESKRGFEKILFPEKPVRKVSLSPINVNNDDDRIRKLENTVALLLTKMNLLEEEVRRLKGEEEEVFEEVEVEVEEEPAPIQNKRLLRK